ncbi:hypothetical protein [Microbulbifer taiwanensis]|uniref:Uncharacterized protein n=1 Tax=Microbulbifer taiwanensis TaxID=986746 RepID=A0ABW1YKF2_9GAMM|nr:hypothetical protein [Microbulbifer taiwanensis]
MGKSFWCLCKFSIYFSLLFHLLIGVFYFIGSKCFYKSYEPLDNFSEGVLSGVKVFDVREVSLQDEDVYLKVPDAPSELRVGRKDRGSVATKLVCNGVVINDEMRRLNGDYALSSRAVYIPLLKDVSASDCAMEIRLSSAAFVDLSVEMVPVVKKYGCDFLSGSPVLSGVLGLGFYFSGWYISFLYGLPVILGVLLTVVSIVFVKKGCKQ